MRKNFKLLDINLHLFDGAAGGAAAGGAGEGVAQGDAGNLPKADTKRSGSSRRSAGAFDNVVFGKQEEATPAAEENVTPAAGETKGTGKAVKTGVETTSDSLEAKRKAFRDLIDGEYKDQYTEEFQKAFSRRHREAQANEQTIAAQKPIMDILMQRYGISDGDVTKLQTAIEQDNTYWEDAAEKAGMNVEQFKVMQRLERENAELKAIRQQQQAEQQRIAGQQKAQQQIDTWYAESEKLKETYPSFDFRTEVQNKEFLNLLKKGVSVEQAYKVIHMDEIEASVAKAAAQSAGAQMAARIKDKSSRPKENGTSSQSAVIVKNDVGNLTREDRDEIARRVTRGEKIRF